MKYEKMNKNLCHTDQGWKGPQSDGRYWDAKDPCNVRYQGGIDTLWSSQRPESMSARNYEPMGEIWEHNTFEVPGLSWVTKTRPLGIIAKKIILFPLQLP